MFQVKQSETKVGLFKLKWKRTTSNISLSDEEVAESLGISIEELHNKMDDPKQFTETERAKLSDMLGAPVAEILEEVLALANTLEEGEGHVEEAIEQFETKMEQLEEKW